MSEEDKLCDEAAHDGSYISSYGGVNNRLVTSRSLHEKARGKTAGIRSDGLTWSTGQDNVGATPSRVEQMSHLTPQEKAAGMEDGLAGFVGYSA